MIPSPHLFHSVLQKLIKCFKIPCRNDGLPCPWSEEDEESLSRLTRPKLQPTFLCSVQQNKSTGDITLKFSTFYMQKRGGEVWLAFVGFNSPVASLPLCSFPESTANPAVSSPVAPVEQERAFPDSIQEVLEMKSCFLQRLWLVKEAWNSIMM